MSIQNLILAIAFIFIGYSAQSQTFISPKQETNTGSFGNRVETEKNLTLIITETTINAALPEGGAFSANISFDKRIERDEETRMLYNIEGGGLVTIQDDLVDDNYDCITINLFATPNKKYYTFYTTLGNKGDD